MEIQVTNTYTGQKEPLITRSPGEVSIYVCGVTPYDAAHLGHARPAVVFDVIRRFLSRKGYRVRLIQNFTDVDDKIIARAAQKGIDPLELSRVYSEEYLSSMDRLNVKRADMYPRVSEHIADVIAMIQGLVDKGVAYPAGGDVYFSVTDFPNYGKLSNQRLSELATGTRFEVDERKRNPLDFALWKAATPGEPAWESPWGPGRPGWHIECSAMSLKYLGNHFDIHGGGMDLVFPHHENEIAQSEAYTGDAPFARYWLHNGLVNVEGEKMSKSLGNFLTVEDALERYPAALLRFFIISSHYRTPVDFATDRLEAARKAWQRLNAVVHELLEAKVDTGVWPGLTQVWTGAAVLPTDGLAGVVAEAAKQLDTALSDDFNTPRAIGVLFDLARDIRSAKTQASAEHLGMALGFMLEVVDDLFGVLSTGADSDQAPGNEMSGQLLDLLVELRNEARQRKDWTQADKIRNRLKDLGVTLEDTPAGTRWIIQE